MKLQDLDIIVTAPPAPGWGGRYWILVKVTTDTGVIGWGECYASSVGPEAMKHMIRDVFERHMMGENPENIELMFRRAYSSGFTQRPDLTVMGAFSGLEIACWDILGKDRDRPVYALLGGRMNDRIRAYTYLYPLPRHDLTDFWTSPEQAGECAAEMVRRGYTAVKFDPAGPYTFRGGHMPAMSDISLSVAFCKAIREGPHQKMLWGGESSERVRLEYPGEGTHPMHQETFELNCSRTSLAMDGTLVVVVEMSLSTWLVCAEVPGLERRAMMKMSVDEAELLSQLHRWRDEAEKRADCRVSRICVAYEAGRDGFWLARCLRGNGGMCRIRVKSCHSAAATGSHGSRSEGYCSPDRICCAISPTRPRLAFLPIFFEFRGC